MVVGLRVRGPCPHVFAPLGLGTLLLIIGLAFFFIPGIGIFEFVLLVVGVLLLVGGFASRRGRTTAR